eukprot:187766_1
MSSLWSAVYDVIEDMSSDAGHTRTMSSPEYNSIVCQSSHGHKGCHSCCEVTDTKHVPRLSIFSTKRVLPLFRHIAALSSYCFDREPVLFPLDRLNSDTLGNVWDFLEIREALTYSRVCRSFRTASMRRIKRSVRINFENYAYSKDQLCAVLLEYGLNRLKYVTLTCGQDSDLVGRLLETNKKIEYVDFGWQAFDSQIYRSISHSTLRVVAVENTPSAIRELSKCDKLESLYLRKPCVRSADCVPPLSLAQWPKLRVLALAEDSGLRPVGGSHPVLSVTHLMTNEIVVNSGYLPHSVPRLRHLILTVRTNADFTRLGALRNLETLELYYRYYGRPVSDADVAKWLSPLLQEDKFPALKTLVLDSMFQQSCVAIVRKQLGVRNTRVLVHQRRFSLHPFHKLCVAGGVLN